MELRVQDENGEQEYCLPLFNAGNRPRHDVSMAGWQMARIYVAPGGEVAGRCRSAHSDLNGRTGEVSISGTLTSIF
jgi:hypothetical protein